MRRTLMFVALTVLAWFAPGVARAGGFAEAQIRANLQKIKLPSGFSISLYASGVTQARQMARGDKGVLFVGSFSAGVVSAVIDRDGRRQVKTILTGLTTPTGLAFHNRALYVAAQNKILRYDEAEDHLDAMPAPKIVYADMPSYGHHGWKYLVIGKDEKLYVAIGAPCNVCNPPPGTAELRLLDPRTGKAQVVARGIRNTVGGDVDPRSGHYWFTENARDMMGDDMPSDKLNVVISGDETYGFPFCHQGDTPDPEFAAGHACSEFTPPVFNLGAHVAPLGMKFYTGAQFPAEYKNSILIAEHGSWNRSAFSGGRVVRVVVTLDGKFVKQDVLASGFLQGARNYIGRPVDILMNEDGSILVSDDFAGAVYRISYDK